MKKILKIIRIKDTNLHLKLQNVFLKFWKLTIIPPVRCRSLQAIFQIKQWLVNIVEIKNTNTLSNTRKKLFYSMLLLTIAVKTVVFPHLSLQNLLKSSVFLQLITLISLWLGNLKIIKIYHNQSKSYSRKFLQVLWIAMKRVLSYILDCKSLINFIRKWNKENSIKSFLFLISVTR